eukprot:scaffold81006_cov42-Attheya_sp.AAC.2
MIRSQSNESGTGTTMGGTGIAAAAMRLVVLVMMATISSSTVALFPTAHALVAHPSSVGHSHRSVWVGSSSRSCVSSQSVYRRHYSAAGAQKTADTQMKMATRRDAMVSVGGLVSVLISPLSVVAVASSSSSLSSAASKARVASWPALEYLEPIYELKLSVDALQAGAGDETKWPLLQKRLDQFFKGFFSERDYYVGLGLQYNSQIKYEANELAEFKRIDAQDRQHCMDESLTNLSSLQQSLSSKDKTAIESNAAAAQASLNRWFDSIPADIVTDVDRLFRATRTADANHDGILSKDEIATLSTTDQGIWNRRVALVGERT